MGGFGRLLTRPPGFLIMPFEELTQRILFVTPSHTLKRLFAYLRNHGGALSGSQAVKRALALRGRSREFYVEIASILFGQDSDIFEHLEEDMYRLKPIDEFNIPLEKATFAVLDIETTGGKPPFERVTEIAILRLDGPWPGAFALRDAGQPEEKNPAVRGSAYGHFRRNGGKRPDDRQSASGKSVISRRKHPSSPRFVRGHAVSGLRLRPSVRRADLDTSPEHAASGRKILPRDRRSGLKPSGGFLGIEIGERHRALADAELTGRVLTRFLVQMNGQTIYDVDLNTASDTSYIRPGLTNHDH